MAGTSNCVPCHCQGSMYNFIPCTPCITNQYGQLPPTVPSCAPRNSVRDTQFACLTNEISAAFFALRKALVDYPDIVTALDAQKLLLITALTDLREPVYIPAEIFERDLAIQELRTAFETIVGQTVDEPGPPSETEYNAFVAKQVALDEKIVAYFQFVKGCC